MSLIKLINQRTLDIYRKIKDVSFSSLDNIDDCLQASTWQDMRDELTDTRIGNLDHLDEDISSRLSKGDFDHDTRLNHLDADISSVGWMVSGDRFRCPSSGEYSVTGTTPTSVYSYSGKGALGATFIKMNTAASAYYFNFDIYLDGYFAHNIYCYEGRTSFGLNQYYDYYSDYSPWFPFDMRFNDSLEIRMSAGSPTQTIYSYFYVVPA